MAPSDWIESFFPLRRHLAIDSANALATGGGKALPTWRYVEVFAPANCQESSNPCTRAAIRTVRCGSPTNPGSGASLARRCPLTPSFAHLRLARVGPRSGPPCFLLPPTSVGAILLALLRQSSAPSQPRSLIRSNSFSPTVTFFRLAFGHQIGRAHI